MKKKDYFDELNKLQLELVKLQYHIKSHKLKVCVLFEGRDAAGKGGIIKRIAQRMSPRVVRAVALNKPTDEERHQWYFQRYVNELPSGGTMVLFDRSWYNRAGVEKVMGFCTEPEYKEFLRSVPEFERMLQNSGVILIKYWMQVSPDIQEERFQDRVKDPLKRWKVSNMDYEARRRWRDYTTARDAMFEHSDLPDSPWYVVNGDDKRKARLNCIKHLLSLIPYADDLPDPEDDFPPLNIDPNYEPSVAFGQHRVPELY